MWDAETLVNYRYDLPEERRKLLDRVRSRFEVPTQGVIIVIDDDDYPDYPNRAWTLEGLHMNIQYGGVEQASPKHLLDIMESKKYAHLVWFSRRVSQFVDIGFVWTVAHELQHLKRDLIIFTLSEAGCFLNQLLPNMPYNGPRVGLYVPTELDAELAAWGAVRSLLGIEAADSYVSNKATSSNGFRLLSSYNPEEPYDVFGETVEVLKKYQFQLRQAQKASKDTAIQQFDIYKACKELERSRQLYQE